MLNEMDKMVVRLSATIAALEQGLNNKLAEIEALKGQVKALEEAAAKPKE